RVFLAELRVKEAAAQQGERLADDDPFRRPRERVASRLAARARDETAAPQNAHQFRHVVAGDSLGLADFGDREGACPALARNSQQATQTVFFLRGKFHGAPCLNDERGPTKVELKLGPDGSASTLRDKQGAP